MSLSLLSKYWNCMLIWLFAIFLTISVAYRRFENGLSPHFQTVSPVAKTLGRPGFKNNQSVTSRSPSRTVKPGMRSAHDLYNKMAEGSEPKLYKEPAVRPPSCTQLEQIARSLGLDITSDQLQAYRGIMKSTIALCDQWLNNQTLNSELVNNRICTRPGGGGG